MDEACLKNRGFTHASGGPTLTVELSDELSAAQALIAIVRMHANTTHRFPKTMVPGKCEWKASARTVTESYEKVLTLKTKKELRPCTPG